MQISEMAGFFRFFFIRCCLTATPSGTLPLHPSACTGRVKMIINYDRFTHTYTAWEALPQLVWELLTHLYGVFIIFCVIFRKTNLGTHTDKEKRWVPYLAFFEAEAAFKTVLFSQFIKYICAYILLFFSIEISAFRKGKDTWTHFPDAVSLFVWLGTICTRLNTLPQAVNSYSSL